MVHVNTSIIVPLQRCRRTVASRLGVGLGGCSLAAVRLRRRQGRNCDHTAPELTDGRLLPRQKYTFLGPGLFNVTKACDFHELEDENGVFVKEGKHRCHKLSVTLNVPGARQTAGRILIHHRLGKGRPKHIQMRSALYSA